MSVLDAIQEWVAKYQMLVGIIVSLGIPTAFAWAFKEYRARIRIEIRDLKFPVGGSDVVRSVSFRAVNISEKLTAFAPAFTMTGVTPKGELQRYEFRFTFLPLSDGLDLRMPPHEERLFLAMHNQTENKIMFFLWYVQIVLPLTSGRAVKVRILNAEKERIGWIRFHVGRVLFRLRQSFSWTREKAE